MTTTKLCFTGRLRVGKDFVAQAVGAKVFGFADPMYKIAEHVFGTSDKDVPGMREFLQRIGQWGRGDVNAQYPLTPERALFVGWMRGAMRKSLPGLHVDWPRFGANADLWVDSLCARIAEADGVLAVSNVRFENELKRLKDQGFAHYHVMTSPGTYAQRLQAAKMDANSPQLRDMSEQLASRLDQQVIDLVRRQPMGEKLRVVWNDSVPAPSRRLLTVEEFKAMVQGRPSTSDSPPAPLASRRHINPGKMPASTSDVLDRMTGLDMVEVEQRVADADQAVKRMVERG